MPLAASMCRKRITGSTIRSIGTAGDAGGAVASGGFDIGVTIADLRIRTTSRYFGRKQFEAKPQRNLDELQTLLPTLLRRACDRLPDGCFRARRGHERDAFRRAPLLRKLRDMHLVHGDTESTNAIDAHALDDVHRDHDDGGSQADELLEVQGFRIAYYLDLRGFGGLIAVRDGAYETVCGARGKQHGGGARRQRDDAARRRTDADGLARIVAQLPERVRRVNRPCDE